MAEVHNAFTGGLVPADMDESALQNRLEAIKRRQFYVLALLSGTYVLAGLWLLVRETAAVTVWHASAGVVGLCLVALFVAVYRRRRARG